MDRRSRKSPWKDNTDICDHLEKCFEVGEGGVGKGWNTCGREESGVATRLVRLCAELGGGVKAVQVASGAGRESFIKARDQH